METSILQQFLDVGLLDVGDDDTKVSSLEKASEEVAKILKKQKRQLLQAILLIMRKRLPDSDAITLLSETAIRNQWQTYRHRFPKDTNQLYRAVLLQAIASVAKGDVTCAAIVYYTAQSLFPYLGGTKEEILFRTFLDEIGQNVEKQAAKDWLHPEVSSLSAPTLDLPTLQYTGLDGKGLSAKLLSAVGPTGSEEQNSVWPTTQPQWATEFAPLAAEAIRSTTNASLGAMLGQLTKQSHADIIKVVTVLIDELKGTQQEGGKKRRFDFLYWKEALYSESKKASYRSMTHEQASWWMATDLYHQLPTLHPHSIEYFLRETLYATIGVEVAQRKVSVTNFCIALGTAPSETMLSAVPLPEGGGSFLDFVQGVALRQIDIVDVEVRLGIPADATIALDEAVVWLLRDMQVRHLIGGK